MVKQLSCFNNPYFKNYISGKGVFTEKKQPKEAFLLEYEGELITKEEGLIREKTYPERFGSFLIFFHTGKKAMW